MNVVLWDIDGTLIKVNSSLKPSKHIKAINAVMKTEINCVKHQYGMTDLELISFYSNMYGIKLSLENKFLVLKKLDQLTKINKSDINVLPGIDEILRRVVSSNFKNGIVTGNTRYRTYLKLKTANLLSMFDSKFIFYGGHFSSREKLVQYIKFIYPNIKFIIVGDSPKDIESAKKSKIKIVSVATGGYSMKELSTWHPELVISNFEDDGDRFLEYINTLYI